MPPTCRVSATDRRAYLRSVLITAVGALTLLGCTAPADPAPAPNLVLVYVDDLGWRDLGIQGSRYYRTPRIDRFASQGVRFTHAYANAPNCAPSRAALLSGTYGPRTGVYTVGSAARGRSALRKLVPVPNRTALDTTVVTLAEALRAAGYATGHVGKWHLGGPGHLPSDQGFDWSVAGDESGTPASYFYPYRNESRTIPGLEEGTSGEYLPDRLTDEAIRFLSENREGPFFLYLSHYSVHTPIHAKPELVSRYEGMAGSDGHDDPVYAAMIESVDQGFGRLLDTLDTLGIADHTVVVFYSDNGGFGPVTSMAPLRGSKGMLYEGGIREPLLVRWPGRAPAGGIVDTPVIGTDLYPTFLEMAGVERPTGVVLDGQSLVPLLEGDPAGLERLEERPLFWHFPAYLERDASVPGPWRSTPVSAVRQGRHKLIHFFEDDRWELYDLLSDPGETLDLVASRPRIAADLQATLEEWWAETEAFLPRTVNPEFDPAFRQAAESEGL
ncbi:MAG: sulfatase [Gemmatimonadales bacterium]|nr:MAG: sulfatase [Gemmatimonadales bacterium]